MQLHRDFGFMTLVRYGWLSFRRITVGPRPEFASVVRGVRCRERTSEARLACHQAGSNSTDVSLYSGQFVTRDRGRHRLGRWRQSRDRESLEKLPRVSRARLSAPP